MKRLKAKKILSIIILTVFTALCFCLVIDTGGYKKYLSDVKRISYVVKVDAKLVLAIVRTESNFNPNSVSKKGAVGLMQLMPETANFIAEKIGFTKDFNLLNPQTNLLLGINYFKYLLDKFKSEEVAIIAYNAGEGNVISWQKEELKEIPFMETKIYLKRIKRRKILYGFLSGAN